MIAPDLALQGGIVAALVASADVTAALTGGFHDVPPQDVNFPYGTLGEMQVISDVADCFEDSAEIYVTLHTWSRPSSRPAGVTGPLGTVEAKAINHTISRALHNANLNVGDGWTLVEFTFRDSRTFTDADGVTVHGVLTFRALMDPA